MVFSTAFGTAVFGFLIDQGLTIESIAFIGAVYVVISLGLLIFTAICYEIELTIGSFTSSTESSPLTSTNLLFFK